MLTAGRSMLYMSLRLFDHYDLIRSLQLDILKLLSCIGELLHWYHYYYTSTLRGRKKEPVFFCVHLFNA